MPLLLLSSEYAVLSAAVDGDTDAKSESGGVSAESVAVLGFTGEALSGGDVAFLAAGFAVADVVLRGFAGDVCVPEALAAVRLEELDFAVAAVPVVVLVGLDFVPTVLALVVLVPAALVPVAFSPAAAFFGAL